MALFGLYDYQRDAINKLANGKILCGGVGSGKSRTSLAYYYQTQGGNLDADSYQTLKNPCDLYIITTARKRDSFEWQKELTPFHLTTHKDISEYDHTVVIDSWNNIGKYKDIRSAFFIFDEDRVTGSGAWVKAFLKITKENNWIILSATPGDTWCDYIPVFVANGFYRNKTDFYQQHVVTSHYCGYTKIERYLVTQRLERLRAQILVPMEIKRHTIPHHEFIDCGYDIDTYRMFMKTRFDPWTREPVTTAASYCYTLRKITNTSTERQMKLLEILEDHPKVIIFYNFTYERDILKDIIDGTGLTIAEWNGQKHEMVPETDAWTYLVQYSAGAEAWNCITTDTVIFYSQNYSYRTLVQACGRIDRVNTPFTDLYYYHLRSRAPIDLAIASAIRTKKKFDENKFATSFMKCAKNTGPIMERH